MKNIGIWLDKEKAYIISLKNEETIVGTIQSEIETFNIGGGSGTRFKGGPQDVVQDSKYLEREKHQLKSYFKEIASQLKNANAIVIFGPAKTNKKFYKELEKNYKDISIKVKAVKKADSMTNNQVKALVKDFFDANKK
jgi:stalled ribosome rescue protein Dom34